MVAGEEQHACDSPALHAGEHVRAAPAAARRHTRSRRPAGRRSRRTRAARRPRPRGARVVRNRSCPAGARNCARPDVHLVPLDGAHGALPRRLQVGRGLRNASDPRAAPRRSTITRASRWLEPCSTAAAYRSTSSATNPSAGLSSRTRGCPTVTVPVLSNTATVAADEPFERGAVPHDDLPARRAIDPADDRHRRGEDQRTRRRDHEDREHAQRIVRREPGAGARRDRRRREPHGVPVGEALQRGLARLRRAHELHDARVLALRRERRRAQPQHARAVERAAHHVRARTPRSPARPLR